MEITVVTLVEEQMSSRKVEGRMRLNMGSKRVDSDFKTFLLMILTLRDEIPYTSVRHRLDLLNASVAYKEAMKVVGWLLGDDESGEWRW
ncbi:hypothetical protein Tco_0631757 [Tanacetum coccineum]